METSDVRARFGADESQLPGVGDGKERESDHSRSELKKSESKPATNVAPATMISSTAPS
jgi:hypothetical protein